MDDLNIDISYLKPSQIANTIEHDAYYIKHGEKQKGTRKIYELVQYDAFEEQLILDLQNECQKHQIKISDEQMLSIYSSWKRSDYLKMQYCGKCKLKDSVKKLQINLEWRATPANHCLNQKSLDFLKQGILYTHGRDKQFRPIIILNAYMVDLKKHDKDMIVQALSYLMGSVRRYMMIPGKVENWIFILETNKIGVFGLPLKGLGVIIDCMSVNFCGCLDKMYILNPSTGLDFTWGAIQSLIDAETKQKINFVTSKTMDKIKDRVDPDQLEKKYGGTRDNLTKFWPPINLDLKGGYAPIPTINLVQEQNLGLEVQESQQAGVENMIYQLDTFNGPESIVDCRSKNDEFERSPALELVAEKLNIQKGHPYQKVQMKQDQSLNPQQQQGKNKKKQAPHVSIMDVGDNEVDVGDNDDQSQPLEASHSHITQFVTFGKVSNPLIESNQKLQLDSFPNDKKDMTPDVIADEETQQQNHFKPHFQIDVKNGQLDEQISFNNYQSDRYPEIEGEQKAQQPGCCSRAPCNIF